jgi:hypothetical protein
MGKTWSFITNYSEQTKTNYLSTSRKQKDFFKRKTLFARAREQKKHEQNTPVKCFVYSHIARLHTLFLHDGQVL